MSLVQALNPYGVTSCNLSVLPGSPTNEVSEHCNTAGSIVTRPSTNKIPPPSGMKILMISNNYAGLSWDRSCGTCLDSSNDMEIASSRDVERIQGWTALLRSPRIQHIEILNSNATKSRIVYTLQELSSEPTIIYINGIGSTGVDQDPHSFTYWPSDCFAEGDITPSGGLTSTEMRDSLLDSSQSSPIMLVTDFSYSCNFLGLPFVLKTDNQKQFHWDTSGKKPELPEPGGEDRVVLHFAATEVGGEAYEFQSTGGIFTREFCNINPICTSLAQWAQSIRNGVESFIDAYNRMHTTGDRCQMQTPQIYSSHRWDLDDISLLKTLGFISA